MNMITQNQVAASQRKLFEGFVAGVAVAAIAIALAWGAFAALNAPKSVAPSATTMQTLQEPGLLDQRAGERGGAFTIPATRGTIMTDSLVEQRRGERGGAVADPAGRPDHLRRGASLEVPKVQKTGATPALDQSVVEHLRGEHGPLR